MNQQMSFLSTEELDAMQGMSVANTGVEVEPQISNELDLLEQVVKSTKEESVMNEVKEKLVLAVAGKPTNGTIFPHEEKLVWKDMQRVIHEMVRNMSEQGGYRLLIPVWNKFDLEFLNAGEKFGVPVTFVLPMESWGNTRLPKFQTDRIIRMKNKPGNTIHIHEGKSFTERVHEAIRMSDMVIGLHGSVGLEQFFPTMNEAKAEGCRIEAFPINRMKYHTEEQAVAFEQSKVENSALAQQDVSSVLQFD